MRDFHRANGNDQKFVDVRRTNHRKQEVLQWKTDCTFKHFAQNSNTNLVYVLLHARWFKFADPLTFRVADNWDEENNSK